MATVDRNFYQALTDRGLIKQATHEDETKELLSSGSPVTLYIGFDPTADSLHVGHMMGLLMLSRFQKAGHRAIALCGGATGMIGDPTGKSELRKVLTKESIEYNIKCLKEQMKSFINFEGDALMVNNADWIADKNYIEFLREVGTHFTVNRMLQAECFKQRMEKGLSFLEFNYMILQGYDFLHLHNTENCVLQVGGDDQWSNIIAGVELVRRKKQKAAFGFTFPLLLTSDGKKMGKTEAGALWLDPNKTSPFEFFQYWRNVQDADVIRLMKMLTFMPLEEIDDYAKLEGQDINKAKVKLALEVTSLVHGPEEAEKAQSGAEKLFSGNKGDDSSMPSTEIEKAKLEAGLPILDLLIEVGFAKSKGDGRRQVKGRGIALNEKKFDDPELVVTADDINEEGIVLLKKGKKNYHKLVVKS